jgi:hydrogenase maturation factor
MEKNHLPIGKLPVRYLEDMLASVHQMDERVLLGPGIGLDCAIIDAGPTLWALKTDPITFASEEIGWYTVQINANDIATTGATPRWMMVALLLPEGKTNAALIDGINTQLNQACKEIGVSIIGGHTEITHGLERPILVATMIGEVSRETLITPRGAQPGDHLLLTKGVPIEATAIIAREFGSKLRGTIDHPDQLSLDELKEAKDFLYRPGISILKDARIACRAGQINAMHDPTEGGLYSALWELAQACEFPLQVDLSQVNIPPLSQRIFRILGLDPFGAIASGALLMSIPAQQAPGICLALKDGGINCQQFGKVLSYGELPIEADQKPSVWHWKDKDFRQLPWPKRDEITKLYE